MISNGEPVQEIESTPGPKYSTMAPVPPFTVKISATFKIISKTKVRVKQCNNFTIIKIMI